MELEFKAFVYGLLVMGVIWFLVVVASTGPSPSQSSRILNHTGSLEFSRSLYDIDTIWYTPKNSLLTVEEIKAMKTLADQDDVTFILNCK